MGKIKRKLFSDGKSRGPLLTRAALKSSHCQKTFLNDACMFIVFHVDLFLDIALGIEITVLFAIIPIV